MQRPTRFVRSLVSRETGRKILWLLLQILWMLLGGTIVAVFYLLSAPPISYPFLFGMALAYVVWRDRLTEPAIRKKRH